MSRKSIPDILDEYTRALSGGQDDDLVFLKRYPAEAAELASLLELVRSLKSTLVPVAPAPGFRQELEGDIAKLSQDESHQSLKGSGQRAWLTVAAAGSLLSVLGLGIILIWRIRGATPSAPAPSGAI